VEAKVVQENNSTTKMIEGFHRYRHLNALLRPCITEELDIYPVPGIRSVNIVHFWGAVQAETQPNAVPILAEPFLHISMNEGTVCSRKEEIWYGPGSLPCPLADLPNPIECQRWLTTSEVNQDLVVNIVWREVLPQRGLCYG